VLARGALESKKKIFRLMNDGNESSFEYFFFIVIPPPTFAIHRLQFQQQQGAGE